MKLALMTTTHNIELRKQATWNRRKMKKRQMMRLMNPRQEITNHTTVPVECNDVINSLNENNNDSAQPIHFDVQDSTTFQDIKIPELHEELKLCGSNYVSIIVVAKILYCRIFCNF
jgi:hypothetical protein